MAILGCFFRVVRRDKVLMVCGLRWGDGGELGWVLKRVVWKWLRVSWLREQRDYYSKIAFVGVRLGG